MKTTPAEPPILYDSSSLAEEIHSVHSTDEPPILALLPISKASEEEEPFVAESVEDVPIASLVESKGADSNLLVLASLGGAPNQERWWLSWKWWLRLPFRIAYRLFQFTSLVVLLAVASSIPILQLAALGYLLEVGRRIALREPGPSLLPGLNQATRIGVIFVGAGLSWLPVWLVSDYAYSAELIEAGSRLSRGWHIAAWIFSIAWVTHVTWAALRGGKWYHFLWPAPLRFLRQIWRPSTWRRAEDGLWQYTVGLQLPKLTWLGLRGALVGVAWLAIPASMMIVGVQANHQPGRVLIGIAGGSLMMLVVMYLPFLQLQMARENRLRSGFDVKTIRSDFQRAPWAFFVAFFLTLALSLPLFLFRIESLPKELLWLPCLFFILLTLPTRALAGWALQRGHRDIPKRLWLSRWVAWTLQIVSVPFYLLFLYLASIASWDGRLIFFIQHAFLVPVPFAGN